jgi:hypothetical protein
LIPDNACDQPTDLILKASSDPHEAEMLIHNFLNSLIGICLVIQKMTLEELVIAVKMCAVK